MARGAVTVGIPTVGTPEKRARQTRWLGDSKNRLRSFPEEVREDIGTAIYWAQLGDKHPDAKPLSGFSGAGVLEIVENMIVTPTAPSIQSDTKSGFIFFTASRKNPKNETKHRNRT
jgi:hypothetical protein